MKSVNDKKIKLRELIPLYIFIYALTAILVAPAHIFPQPFFMPLRFPHYLEMMPAFLGTSWPMTFEIYHWVLLIIGVIGTINALGLAFSNMKSIAKLSSFIGLFLFSSMILFFFFIFINVNLSTALIFGLYSVVLLIADWLTFKTLTKEQKEALRG